MRIPLNSFRFSLFIVLFSVSIIPLLIFSTLTLNTFNAKTDILLEKEIFIAAETAKERFHEASLDLLRVGLLLARDPSFEGNYPEMQQDALVAARDLSGLDIATLIDQYGRVIVRANNAQISDRLSFDGFISQALITGAPSVSTELISEKELRSEGESLAVDSSIRRIYSLNHNQPDEPEYQTDGMALVAVIPLSGGRFLVLADLINRDSLILESIKGKAHASIYQRDVRIATTLRTSKNNPYIGTLMPDFVADTIFIKNKSFLGRLWDTKWSRAAYLPIQNYAGETIGALELSVQEQDYMSSPFFARSGDLTHLIIIIVAFIALVSLFASWLLASYVAKPLADLIIATREISSGSFDKGIQIHSFDEINELAAHFNMMIRDMRRYIIKREREIVDECKRRKR